MRRRPHQPIRVAAAVVGALDQRTELARVYTQDGQIDVAQGLPFAGLWRLAEVIAPRGSQAGGQSPP